MNASVNSLTLHNDQSESVLASDLLDWAAKQNPWRTFDATGYSWYVGEQKVRLVGKDLYLCLLPDSSGFICFERDQFPNNCTLLDAYGKERMRLTVPWQLTTANNPASNAPPTSFAGISQPYINPADGKKGQFGVKAWVEFAGEYYFELHWRTGQFLWGKEIRF